MRLNNRQMLESQDKSIKYTGSYRYELCSIETQYEGRHEILLFKIFDKYNKEYHVLKGCDLINKFEGILVNMCSKEILTIAYSIGHEIGLKSKRLMEVSSYN